MVNYQTLLLLKNWFLEYSRSFSSPDPEKQKCLDLKEKHTFRVCGTIKEIAASLELSWTDINIAETIALFHDLGRFEQFTQYGTFLDSKSVNHAELAVKIIEKEGILGDLHEETLNTILYAILNHNIAELSDDCSDRQLLFAKMIRDADKLDIYNFSTEYFTKKTFADDDPVILGVKDVPVITEGILEDLKGKSIVRKKNLLHSLNDFKLLQVSWVYDLNFSKSFEIIKDKKYIEKIFMTLPPTEEMSGISDMIHAHIDEHISSFATVSCD